jgi:hypothetical protein
MWRCNSRFNQGGDGRRFPHFASISNLLSNAVKFFPSGGEVSPRSRISARWGAFLYAIRDRACPTITKPASTKNSSRLTPPAPTAIQLVDQRAGHRKRSLPSFFWKPARSIGSPMSATLRHTHAASTACTPAIARRKAKANVKNGNKYLAWAFIEAANFARRFCPEAKRSTNARRPGPTTSSLPRRWRTSRCAPAITF